MKTRSAIRAKRVIVASTLFLCASSAWVFGEGVSECAGAAYHQFDFWLGEWEIEQRILQSDGTWLKLPAHNRVTAAAGGCALIERWAGPVKFFWEGMADTTTLEGLSIRYYDAQREEWVIQWMDSRNPTFHEFRGRFDGSKGEFFRDRRSSAGDLRQVRVTFTRPGEGKVQWELAVSSETGTWTLLWSMTMTRAG